MSIKFYLISVLLLIHCNIYGMRCKQDTLQLCDSYCVVKVPFMSVRHFQSYEEGVFYSFLSLEDSVLVTVPCGSLVNIPFKDAKNSNVTILRTDSTKEKSISFGYEIVNGVEKYFWEIYINKQKITLLYENIEKQKLNNYCEMANSVFVFE